MKRLHIPPNQYLKITSILLVILGVSLGPCGFINYFINEEAHSSQAKFARILFKVKKDCEADFSSILNAINDDPLDEIVKSKLPTTEEIFLSEWANDWFPNIEIAIVGNIIEETGAELVGDINLDNKDPEADLNISSRSFPSNISLLQCKALWNRENRYSLIFSIPHIWFDALNGNNQSRNLLRYHFDLTERQLNLILTWVDKSYNGWTKDIAYIDVFIYMNYAFLGLGISLGLFGLVVFLIEQRKLRTAEPLNIKQKSNKT
jgi:hypothetical protein